MIVFIVIEKFFLDLSSFLLLQILAAKCPLKETLKTTLMNFWNAKLLQIRINNINLKKMVLFFVSTVTFINHFCFPQVSFFSGCKAVDCLLNDSPWAKAKVADPDKAELVFETREQCVDYLDELLKHKMFHRAKKIPVNICLMLLSSKNTELSIKSTSITLPRTQL
jgi:hypothetical protein